MTLLVASTRLLVGEPEVIQDQLTMSGHFSKELANSKHLSKTSTLW